MKFILANQQTQRLHFRAVSRDDFDAWVEFFKDSASFKHWDAERTDPVADCNHWYNRQFERYEHDEGGMNAIIETSTGKLAGHGGLLIQQVDGVTEIEVAYSLLSTHRNKGYATEFAIRCRDFAFENNFAPSLISIISLSNTPSARVAEKNGMKVDKQTIYRENDVNIFRIYRGEWESNSLRP